jgi:hypothetical protein
MGPMMVSRDGLIGKAFERASYRSIRDQTLMIRSMKRFLAIFIREASMD